MGAHARARTHAHTCMLQLKFEIGGFLFQLATLILVFTIQYRWATD